MITAVLAVIPIIHYYLHRLSIITPSRLRLFYKHWTIRYFDILFIPFNVVLPLTTSFDNFAYYVLFGLAFSVVAHRYWGYTSYSSHLFRKNSTELTFAGVAHVLFCTFETALVLVFITSTGVNVYTYVAGIILAVYALLLPVGSRHLNGAVQHGDVVVTVLLLVGVVVRLIPGL